MYQPHLVHPDIKPAAVYDQPASLAQRDPNASINLPLANGLIVQRGDLVRFPETQAEGRVVEVERPPRARPARA